MKKKFGNSNVWRRSAAAAATIAVTAAAGVATAAFIGPGAGGGMVGSDTLFDAITSAITQSGVAITYVGTGSGNGENALNAFTQAIAPMSRNMKVATLTAHPTWKPTVQNVLALDAAVLVQKAKTPSCSNDPETQNHWLKLILGGVDGSGSKDACSHPSRQDAIDQLTSCLGVNTLFHFLRRDDNSGTSDTMQEKLGFAGYCNNGTTSKASIGPTNDKNSDKDPIRSKCPPAIPHLVPDVNNTCGFLLAISEGTPSATDAIAKLIATDPDVGLVGYTGREGAYGFVGQTKQVNINTIVPSTPNIRKNIYPLSRKLFLQKGDPNMNGNLAAKDPTHEQHKLLAWATSIDANVTDDPKCFNPQGDPNGDIICGRQKMDPIMKQYGFITCTDDFSDPTDVNNLCAADTPGYTAPVVGTPCIQNGSAGTVANCCRGGVDSNGKCCGAANSACTTNGDCCSGLTCLAGANGIQTICQ